MEYGLLTGVALVIGFSLGMLAMAFFAAAGRN